MLSKRLGPTRLRHITGVIIFAMLGLMMTKKAYLDPQPIDRPEIVEGALSRVEPLTRTVRGETEVKTLKLMVEGDPRGFLIYPAVFASGFDRDAFETRVPLGTKVRLEVRPQRLPVIFAMQAGGETYIDREATRAHLAGRLGFLRLASFVPWMMALAALFFALRTKENDDAAP